MLKIKGELDRAIALNLALGGNGINRRSIPLPRRPIAMAVSSVGEKPSPLEYFTDPPTGELLVRAKK